MGIRVLDWSDFPEDVHAKVRALLFRNVDGASFEMSPSDEFFEDHLIYLKEDHFGIIYITGVEATFHWRVRLGEELVVDIQYHQGVSEEGKIIQAIAERQREERYPGQIVGIDMNVPEFFMAKDFLAWLNNDERRFTWHNRGSEPDDYSDVVITLDPSLNGEGSDTDMPEWCHEIIMNEARRRLRKDTGGRTTYMVRLTNLAV